MRSAARVLMAALMAAVVMASVRPSAAPAAGSAMSVAFLRTVDGVTPEVYAALSPYLTALPDNHTTLNVNTAFVIGRGIVASEPVGDVSTHPCDGSVERYLVPATKTSTQASTSVESP